LYPRNDFDFPSLEWLGKMEGIFAKNEGKMSLLKIIEKISSFRLESFGS